MPHYTVPQENDLADIDIGMMCFGSFNLGYIMAFWNVHERRLSKSLDGKYMVNEKFPLIFFHFISFDDKNPEFLSKQPFPEKAVGRQDWLELSLSYKANLEKHTTELSKTKYGFDYMSNGDYISPTLRRAYVCVLDELPEDHDPFDSDGLVGQFTKRNFLIEKKNFLYVYNSYGDMNNHKIKFAVINYMKRLIIRIIRPNRFANFSRLLVYLSSYRQNRDL